MTSTSDSDASWLNSAEADANVEGGELVSLEELLVTETELAVDLNGDGHIGSPPITTAITGL